MRKHLLILSFAAIACCAVAEQEGRFKLKIEGFTYEVKSPRDAQSGQSTGRRQYKPFTCSVSPEESFSLIELIEARFRSGTKYWSFACDKYSPSGKGLHSVSMEGNGVESITMPACDASSKDPAYMSLGFDVQARKYDPPPKDPIGPPRGNQKSWLPANFRLRIDDMQAMRVSKVDAITIKQGTADVDGDGVLDVVISDPVFEVPFEDAVQLTKWPRDAASGLPTGKRMHVDYPYSDGSPFAELSFDVVPVSIDWADVFESDMTFPGRMVRVQCVAGNPKGYDLKLNKKV